MSNEGVLLRVKLPATLLRVTVLHGFPPFLYCTNGTKSRKALHMSAKS